MPELTRRLRSAIRGETAPAHRAADPLDENDEGADCMRSGYGPYTTIYNRYHRWAKVGIWLRLSDTLATRIKRSLHG